MNVKPFAVAETKPIRKRVGFVLSRYASGCEWEHAQIADYPPSPLGKALQKRRRAAAFNLGSGARRMGITVATLSGLETGRYNFADPADWERAMALFSEPTKET